ncbi:hypothetical protein ACFSYG_11980 [Leeuwenhoekiella polynyae]|uniref:Uncharacterized protein n=1 Tax=Leeuwenhoekiella polynyae TaxID=1550906 RepID=A0A4Q0PGL6_9FLAO|nr:hypothetical protein [Leeuwenhoekiella polynyae]RXG25686.1 hypothetical protein DSM02_853 [Leeuwenhoekiella polynyae]
MQNNDPLRPVPRELTKTVLNRMYSYLNRETVPVEINAIAQKMRAGSATGFKRRFRTVRYEEFLILTQVLEWPRGYRKPDNYNELIEDLKAKLSKRGINLF